MTPIRFMLLLPPVLLGMAATGCGSYTERVYVQPAPVAVAPDGYYYQSRYHPTYYPYARECPREPYC